MVIDFMVVQSSPSKKFEGLFGQNIKLENEIREALEVNEKLEEEIKVD